MGLLDQLIGGAGGGQDRRAEYQNYADRYDSGRPHEGYDDEEVSRRYSEVSGDVDEDTYRQSARQSFERMGPDDRREFGRQLDEHARGQGYDTGFGSDADERLYEDPGRLADMTTRVHQQNPGVLGQLLGGGGGGGLGGLLGGVGGGAGSTGNPVAKAAMAGIAAYAAKQLMNRR